MLPIDSLNFYVSGLLSSAANSIDRPHPLSALADHVNNLPVIACPASLRQVGEALRVSSWQVQEFFGAFAPDHLRDATLAGRLHQSLFSRTRDSMTFLPDWQRLTGSSSRTGYLAWAAGLDRVTAYALATVGWAEVLAAGPPPPCPATTSRRLLDQALASALRVEAACSIGPALQVA